jgi:hypothetical protein
MVLCSRPLDAAAAAAAAAAALYDPTLARYLARDEKKARRRHKDGI